MTGYDPKRPRRRPDPADAPAPVDALIDLAAAVVDEAPSSPSIDGAPRHNGSSPAGVHQPAAATAAPVTATAAPVTAARTVPPDAWPTGERSAEQPLPSVRAVPAIDGPDDVLSGRARVAAAVAGAAVVVVVVGVVVVRRRRR